MIQIYYAVLRLFYSLTTLQLRHCRLQVTTVDFGHYRFRGKVTWFADVNPGLGAGSVRVREVREPDRDQSTLNCTDTASLGVATDGTAKQIWDSINNEWGKSTDMRRSHAQEALNRTTYEEGTDIQEHIKILRTRKVMLDNLSTSGMNDEAWRGIIIRSIPPTAKWLPVISSLYSMSTSADIISTLLAHGMILGRESKPKNTNSSTAALSARTTEGCTNPNCKARKRTTHTTNNCYWPGGGKEGQFPPNFNQKSKANTATTNTTPNTGTTPSSTSNTTTTAGQTDHFVLSARIPTGPGRSGILIDGLVPEQSETLFDLPHIALISKSFQSLVKGKIPTFMDSGASDTMFVSKDEFSEYQPINPRTGDLLGDTCSGLLPPRPFRPLLRSVRWVHRMFRLTDGPIRLRPSLRSDSPDRPILLHFISSYSFHFIHKLLI